MYVYILCIHTHIGEGLEQSSRSVLRATRTGGITAALEGFSTEDLAAVLKAAFPKIKTMLDLARSVKKVDSKAFAHVHLTDNGRKLAKDHLPKIVKSIFAPQHKSPTPNESLIPPVSAKA